MNSLNEKKHEIDSYWDIEDESYSKKLLKEIREYAEKKSEAEFIAEVRENFTQISDSGIGVIYQVLSENPKRWSNFFKEEYQRAFEAAEKSRNPFEILESLEDISPDVESYVESRDDIIELLQKHLSNVNAAIRFKAIYYLGDWISDDNKTKYFHLIRMIEEKLKDENWKVRYIAQTVLDDIVGLPNSFQLSFIDKLKAKFLNPFKF